MLLFAGVFKCAQNDSFGESFNKLLVVVLAYYAVYEGHLNAFEAEISLEVMLNEASPTERALLFT